MKSEVEGKYHCWKENLRVQCVGVFEVNTVGSPGEVSVDKEYRTED